MTKIKKETKSLNIKISKEIYEQLEAVCEETGRTKTVVVEKTLQRYFDDYFQRPQDKRVLF